MKLGISPAKTPRPQRSENNNKQFFQDNLSSLRNLACLAPWRESSLLIASFMSNSKCLHLRGTTLVSWNQSSFKKMQPMAAAEVVLKSPLIPLFSKGELLNCGFNPSLEKRGRGDFDPTLRKLFNEF